MRNENRVNKVVVKKIIGYCEDIEKFINRFGNNFENFVSDRAFQMSCGMCIIITPTVKIPTNFEIVQSDMKFAKEIFGFIVVGVIRSANLLHN